MPLANLAADRHELKAVTGLRGVAALLVVCFHFGGLWVAFLPFLKRVSLFSTPVGALGVDLFFIMSGFILNYVYFSERNIFQKRFLATFIWFRFARIYPNQLATLLILGVLLLAARMFHVTITGAYPLSDLPAQLTLTHVWPLVPHALPASVWNYPSWSISAEWFAYLAIFPISLFLATRRLGRIGGIGLILGLLICWFLWSAKWGKQLPNVSTLVQVSCEFLAGGLAFGLFLREKPLILKIQAMASPLAVVLVTLCICCGANFLLLGKGSVLLFPFMLLALTSEASFASKLLCQRGVFWLGKISYSIYMVHAIILKIVKGFCSPSIIEHAGLPVRLGLFLCTAGAVLGAAALLYYCVEDPARKYLRVHRPSWVS